jgi:S-adenosyl-L-methionine hydrolase (adenosine-forming)
MSSSVIACLTDFGDRDPYAGILKAVVLGIAPWARWVDLTHAVAPGAVRQAALAAWQSAPYLPEGSILLAVVDPGVGSARRPIAVAWEHWLAVGPDNGLFSYLAMASPPQRIIEINPVRIDPPQPISHTFHGRDVFAVAAARLAAGEPIESLGNPIPSLTLLPAPQLELDAERATVAGEVIHFDHFGNALISIGALCREGGRLGLKPWLRQFPPTVLEAEKIHVVWAENVIPFLATYSEAHLGAPLAYIGSSGLLEIAIRGGRADEALGLRLDDRVQLCYKG